MASNQYFNFYTANNEQSLVDDLVSESIKQFAHDMYYLPRTGVNKDETLNEFEYNSFNTALPCEFYIKSSSSFEGQGMLLEKFGLQIKNQITLTVSVKSFKEFIKPTTLKERVLEGDLIYVPMLKALYEVTYVETSMPFYQLGDLQSWDITLELYESANDVFNTSMAEIDDTYNAMDDIANDPYDQGDDFETSSNTVLDFSEVNIFGDGF
jgi:hypothetical protein